MHELLDKVHGEEADAHQHLGEMELELGQSTRGLQRPNALRDLGQQMEKGGGEQNATAEAEEERDDDTGACPADPAGRLRVRLEPPEPLGELEGQQAKEHGGAEEDHHRGGFGGNQFGAVHSGIVLLLFFMAVAGVAGLHELEEEFVATGIAGHFVCVGMNEGAIALGKVKSVGYYHSTRWALYFI